MPTKAMLYRCAAASLIVLAVDAAWAENIATPLDATSAPKTQPFSQTIYKGVVGTVLDEVPIDSERRVELQRGSAVISNTLSGRSLAVMLGVSNPVLMALGLAWGIFAASQIHAAPAEMLCRDFDSENYPTFSQESLASAP